MPQRLLLNTNQLSIVRNIPLFSGLTEEEKDAVLKGGGVYSYPRKKCLFRQGDPIKYFYIVCSGIVQEFRGTFDGHEVTVNIHKTGDILCKTGMFLKDGLHHTNATAVDNVCVVELPVAQFKENLKKYESVANHMFFSLAEFATMKQREVEQQSTMTSPEILALFLRQICNSHGLDPRGFTLPYKKTLIASRLGMEIETLSRALFKLKKYGIMVKGTHVSFYDSQRDHMSNNCSKVLVHPDFTMTEPVLRQRKSLAA